MRVPFLDIKAQYTELQTEIDRTIIEIISSGSYVLGPHNKALEAEIARRHGVAHAIAVNSGTDALRIMMEACGIKSGDEVITTAFTFVASAETIIQVGAIPVFVDIDPVTFNIDPSKIEQAITAKTRAIMPIHLYGQLAEVDAISRVAQAHGLQVLEDAAQAFGCRHDGVFSGNFGSAAALSFYVTKNLGAAGDGGMILSNDPDVDGRCRSLRVHGMGRERYYYDAVGYTSRLDEIQAGFLMVKLSRLDAWNDRRRELAAIYDHILGPADIQIPQASRGNNHTYHQYTIRSSRRDELQAFLKSREIDSMVYYPVPLHFHEPYRPYGRGEGSLYQTELAAREVLSLPIHPHLTDEQVGYAASSVLEFSKQTAAV